MKPEFFTILRLPATLIVVALLVCVPFVSPTYYLHLAILCLVCWTQPVVNIIGGIAGQLSLAHSLSMSRSARSSQARCIASCFNMWLAIVIFSFLAVAVGAAVAWLNFASISGRYPSR